MAVFLLMFLGVYGGMNAFAWWSVQRGWPWAREHRWWLLAAFLLMTVAPILARLVDRWGRVWISRPAAWAAYTWMGLVFWLFMFMIAVQVWNLGWRLTALGVPRMGRLALPPGRAVAVAGILLVLACLWGVVEAQLVRTHTLTLSSPRLPAGSAPVRAVLIADMHLGPFVEMPRWRRIVRRIQALEPDLLLCAGDLVDGRAGHAEAPALLAAIETPLGKFSVTGNHEFYGGLDEHLDFHRACGFEVLRGEHRRVNENLVVAGVDDPAGKWQGEARLDEDVALPPADAPGMRIFLKHQPVVRENSLGRFDLQLSGHGHGGQIWPFHLFVWMAYGNLHGRHDLPGGATFYVTRGTGTWGPPMRLFAPPEILVIDIHPAAGP